MPDIFGRLEGESVVGSIIQDTPNLWCFEEPPRSQSHTSQKSLSTTLNSSLASSTIPPTPTTSPTGELLEDWKEPIRRLTHSSLDINVRISPTFPADISYNYPPAQEPAPPSTDPSLGWNPIVGNSPIDTSQSRLPIKIQIPETSTRSKPLPQLPPVASPRLATPPTPEKLFVLPSHPTSTQVPYTAHPLLMPRPLPRPPGTSSRAGSQEDTFSGGPLPSQPALIAGAPLVTTNATIVAPWHDVSIRKPHPQAGTSFGGHPGQPTDPDSDDGDLSDNASTITPTSLTRKRKKRKWYQRILDRVDRVVYRRSSQQVNASMPNLTDYGISQRSP